MQPHKILSKILLSCELGHTSGPLKVCARALANPRVLDNDRASDPRACPLVAERLYHRGLLDAREHEPARTGVLQRSSEMVNIPAVNTDEAIVEGRGRS